MEAKRKIDTRLSAKGCLEKGLLQTVNGLVSTALILRLAVHQVCIPTSAIVEA